MRKLFLKALNIITFITHPKIPFRYCFFIRDNYYSRLVQAKYFFKDYVDKKKYKTIELFGEFQQELAFVLPFAYWHYLNGTLAKTVSSNGTHPFYFFSENHRELSKKRDWLNNSISYEIPNMAHSNSFSYKKWAKVPLKEYYKNEHFIFDKPLLIIANKYNIEWQNNPINFLDISTLDRIIKTYKSKYQIIYNRPLPAQIVLDESEILDLGEHDWMKSTHPEVILMNDLLVQHHTIVKNFNHLQLLVYANCSKFISVHGGTGTLASYFGGTNIIYSKKGLEHIFNEFNTIFPMLSGAIIFHAKTETELLNYLENRY
jgi:hypothetical protein